MYVEKYWQLSMLEVWYGLGGCGWKDVGMVATR